MNLSKELEKINKNKNSINGIIDSLSEDREELNRKLHVLKVVKIANDIDDLIQIGLFEQDNIFSVELHNKFDDDYAYRIIHNFTDKNNAFAYYHNQTKNLQEYSMLRSLFEIINGFNPNHASENFGEDAKKVIRLDSSFKEEFINLLLSKELKIVLDYHTIDNELVHSNINQIKKNKV